MHPPGPPPGTAPPCTLPSRTRVGLRGAPGAAGGRVLRVVGAPSGETEARGVGPGVRGGAVTPALLCARVGRMRVVAVGLCGGTLGMR